MVKAGEVLLGKYRVERLLGQGGMGSVLAARHIELDERVAIKLLLPQSAESAEVVARFIREARAAARIKSEHVARVMDVGRLPDGEPYMVMEYLEGSDLEQLLRSGGPLSLSDAVDYVLQALEAIGEAHSIGIIHRDLKPANIFLTRRSDGSPWVKVIDFGIAKFADATTGGAMTKTAGMMGSALYMSPEQLQSTKDVDARTDIWAIGVILYQLLSNTFPFIGDSLPQLVAQVFTTAPVPLESRRSDLPIAFTEVVARCLAKSRDERYPNVAALARALAPFGSRRSAISVERLTGSHEAPAPVLVAAPTLLSTAAQTMPSWGATAPPVTPARGKWRPLATALAAVAVGIVGTVAVLHSRGATHEAAAAPQSGSMVAPAPVSAKEPTTVAAPSQSTGLVPPAPSAAKSASSEPPSSSSSTKPKGVATAKTSSSSASQTTPPSASHSGAPPSQPSTKPPPKPAVDCSMPYYFEEGIKHFKEGCE